MHLQETVQEIYTYLCTPFATDVLENKYPEPAIQAIKNFGEGGCREVAFVTVVGSHNYEVNDANSDIDLKATYLPSLEDLYFASFPKFSIVTDSFDCTLAPIHEYKRHMLKGNMNFFEPLYSKAIALNPCLENFWDIMRILVAMNVGEACLATFFTAREKHRLVERSDTHFGYEYKPKEAAHAMRLLHFVDTLVHTGVVSIVPTPEFKDLIASIRRKEITKPQFYEMFRDYQEDVTKLVFEKFVDGGNYTFSERVLELDGSKTEEFKELSTLADKELVAVLRETF